MVDKLVERGATIVEIGIPDLSEMRVGHNITISTDMNSYARTLQFNKLTASTRIMLNVSASVNGYDYVSAARLKTRGINTMRTLFSQVDLIVTPTTAIVAPPIPPSALAFGLSDFRSASRAMMYIYMANYLGLPAVTAPAGYSKDKGMPIGVHFMANWWNEALLLRMANVCEHILADQRRAAPEYVKLV
nr:hypothetical protein HK105_001016 [Polyrhizophydium stewartii]